MIEPRDAIPITIVANQPWVRDRRCCFRWLSSLAGCPTTS